MGNLSELEFKVKFATGGPFDKNRSIHQSVKSMTLYLLAYLFKNSNQIKLYWSHAHV
jgi:hypothetical protein